MKQQTNQDDYLLALYAAIDALLALHVAARAAVAVAVAPSSATTGATPDSQSDRAIGQGRRLGRC
jgi:hypothetical protein